MPIQCRHCSAGPQECKGWLERVNEKGVPGEWECRPVCGADLPPDERALGAIEGVDGIRRAAAEKEDG